jgi:hypothetical protein
VLDTSTVILLGCLGTALLAGTLPIERLAGMRLIVTPGTIMRRHRDSGATLCQYLVNIITLEYFSVGGDWP